MGRVITYVEICESQLPVDGFVKCVLQADEYTRHHNFQCMGLARLFLWAMAVNLHITI